MIDRSKKPEQAEEITFQLPELNRYRLSNGLQIYFIKLDKLPIVQMYLVTKAGSKFDPKEKSGLSQLFTSLLDEGAGEYDSLALSEEFEMLGSVLNTFADQDFAFISLLTLTEHFERSVELFAKVTTQPRFDIADFNRAIELSPQNGMAYNNRGFTFILMGKYEEAENDIKKSLELNPNNIYALNSMAELYSAKNDAEKACMWVMT